MKNIGIGILVLCVLGVTAWGLSQKPVASTLPLQSSIPEGAHVVVLTKDGFQPDKLTIKVGETVAFTTTTANLFWPASNLHPSHLIYPEFDPEEPVQPDSAWSFTFTKTGEWKFHDHLSPYFTGVITVTE